MYKNDNIWLIILLIGIVSLWFKSRSLDQHIDFFETIEDEKNWYKIQKICNEKFDRNKMDIFFECIMEYGRIIEQEWHDGRWINKPKWIWTGKYYEEFDLGTLDTLGSKY